MIGCRSFALLATFLMATVPAAVCAQDPVPPKDDRDSFSLLIENDLFSGTDRHYTHGTRLSWMTPSDQPLPSSAEWLARTVPLFAPGGRKRLGFAIGQNMYTPADITVSALQPDDRPYAGWLYGEMGLLSETGNRLDSMTLSLGVVGPASFAGTVQERWHEWFGFTEPKGWDNQLDNEPAINLMVDRQWRYLGLLSPNGGLGVDMTPHVGASLGNVFTYAATGVTFRFGDNLQYDFGGPPRIRPSLPGSAHFTPRDGFGWYLFAGGEMRAIARNIFLDGNTFSDSHSVDKKTLVGDIQAGVALIFPTFRVTFTQIYRTKEFYGQGEPDHFGAVSVTTRF